MAAYEIKETRGKFYIEIIETLPGASLVAGDVLGGFNFEESAEEYAERVIAPHALFVAEDVKFIETLTKDL